MPPVAQALTCVMSHCTAPFRIRTNNNQYDWSHLKISAWSPSYLKSINFGFWDCDCNLTILDRLGLMANLTWSDLFKGSSYTCMTVFLSEDVSSRLFNLLDLSGVRLRERAQNLPPNLAGRGASGAGGFSIYKSWCPPDTFHVVCFMTSCQLWYLYARQCDRQSHFAQVH